MERLVASLTKLVAPRYDVGVPYMAPSYKAQNRNVAVIMLRETLAGRV